MQGRQADLLRGLAGILGAASDAMRRHMGAGVVKTYRKVQSTVNPVELKKNDRENKK